MDKRLIYRVVIKLLFLLALSVLIIVFINSLFTRSNDENNQQASSSIVVKLDVRGMIKGDIRKAQWEGKEVNVLRLENNKHFIYINTGDSGNCPLFKEANGFKDICTGTRFDFSGRKKGSEEQGVKLEVPPTVLKNTTLFIGKVVK